MKKIVFGVMLIAGITLFAAGCASTPPAAGATAASVDVPAAKVVKISMQGLKFIPAVLKIPVGTTVIWINMDLNQHDVRAEDNSFTSNLIAGGQTFQFTFKKAGLFPYYCGLHGGPGGKGMSGTVEVTP
jgi:plastocyanin